jgi:hypothetical protein
MTGVGVFVLPKGVGLLDAPLPFLEQVLGTRRKIPSPRTSLAGTQLGLERASRTRVTRPGSSGSGASSRMKPINARTAIAQLPSTAFKS